MKKKLLIEDLEKRRSTSSLFVAMPSYSEGSNGILESNRKWTKPRDKSSHKHIIVKYAPPEPPINAKYAPPSPIVKYAPPEPPISAKYAPPSPIVKYAPPEPPIHAKYAPPPYSPFAPAEPKIKASPFKRNTSGGIA
jgi:hypothetical protein